MANRNHIHHPWNISVKRAAKLQSELAQYVSLKPLTREVRVVAGVDSAEWKEMVFVAVVVMKARSGKVIEITHAHAYARFSYLAGYRAFREGPIALRAIKNLRNKPDLFFISGQGVCHPRLLGIASHLGLWINKPTIGCTEKRLVGHYEPVGETKGEYSVIRYSPMAPGVVLRTRDKINPVFVSPGHRIDLLGAIDQTLEFCTKYRLPEPLRRAHIEAGRDMRRYRDERIRLGANP
jgi:deoxyribonuclease V